VELKSIIKDARNKWLDANINLVTNPIYQYGVDVLSGWVYYTPTYAAQELAAGKSLDTVIKTRLIGMGVQALIFRPIGLLRNYVAKKLDVTQDSSFIEKMKVNLITIVPTQAVAYAGILFASMTWAGKYDLKESAIAWGVGVGVGALHAIPYGYVQDGIRKFFGVKPAIGTAKK